MSAARDAHGRFVAPVLTCPECDAPRPHHRCRTGTCVHCDVCGHGRPPGPILTDGNGRPIEGDAVADVANRAFARQFSRSIRGAV